MITPRAVHSLLFSSVLLLLTACGTSETLGSRYVVATTVVASQGAELTVTAADSAELAGTHLSIPPGALAQNTLLTLEIGMSSIVGSASPLSPVVMWGPSGLKFSKPVTMTLPTTATSAPEVVVLEADGSTLIIREVALNTRAKTASFSIAGFSQFQLRAANRSDAGTDGGSFTEFCNYDRSGNVVISAEVCNGRDDDCNGIVDEGDICGFLNDGGSFGENDGGYDADGGTSWWAFCNYDSSGNVIKSGERCNGRDDDCDGNVDEGQVCGWADGGTSTCSTEICNGLDDDCDGYVDEINCGTNDAGFR